MKRPAIRLLVCFAACFAAAFAGGISRAQAAKKAGAKAAAPAQDKQSDAQTAADQAAPAAPEEKVPAATDPAAEGEAVVPGEGIGAGKGAATLSWQDVVVVPRKAFLKGGRVELSPFTGMSVNDNLIRHFSFGGEFNYFLTDVLWVGLQGQYFIKALTEREELLGLQYNRIPTLNRYLYAGALNFGYVPAYGKFTLFNRSILHWEIYASAGFGLTRTEIIPRNPGNTAFTTDALTPNAGLGARFFLFDWLTFNVALRDYIFADKFEPINRDPLAPIETVKAAATSELVNNLMLYAGVGVYLPMGFQYKSPR
ncbi:MAG TPA: outer membrane beta-barrel domain-containing protein [Polyangia bacterium]|nr:outer membrane beta-barrel domain-containing protein [Polyangia bacterium]